MWINNQENIPLDVAVMTGGVIVSVMKGGDAGGALASLYIVYTVLRYAWFTCYKLKMNQPPLRTAAFGLSKLTMLVIGIVSLTVAFKKD